MPFRRRTLVLVIAAVVLLPPLVWWGLYLAGIAPAPGERLRPPFNLSDRLVSLTVEERAGEVVAVFEAEKGSEEPLVYTGDQLLREVLSRKRTMPSLFRVLDITAWTGVFWVALGFLGQALFMGRMLVQWWASEKVKSAVVPPSFWWLSLVGSSMLMTYFVWRVEIVGFLGQSTGWLIYIRNLWFIYGGKAEK
jgi:lipid-A-disaccharide synthase-like uncharacterized protein